MTGSDGLKEKIESGRVRLGELDRERLILITQIEAYEEALEIVSAATPKPAAETGSRSSRRTSDNWKSALYPLIKGRNRIFSTDDLLREATDQGFDLSRGNIRSQMGAFKKKGWIKSPAEGKYTVTDEGRNNLLSADQLDDRLQWDPFTKDWAYLPAQAELPEDEYAD